MNNAIDSQFFNTVIYSLLSAMARRHGREDEEQVVKLAADIAFSELRGRVEVDTSSPVSLIQSLLGYLENVGYLRKGAVDVISETEVVIHLYGAAAREAVVKLRQEGAYPPHLCTNLIFSGLSTLFGVKPEITHLDIRTAGDSPFGTHTVERWTLTGGR